MATRLDEERTPGFAQLYDEANQRFVRVRVPPDFTVRTPKESTVNLKQNELLALIATYSRELNMMIESRSSGAGSFRDEGGPQLKGLVQSHVARIAQLSAELA